MAAFSVKADKKPLTEHGLKDTSTDSKKIEGWWNRWPAADIAWALSADFVVADFDTSKGRFSMANIAPAHGDALPRRG
jgi:hypothetical protein